MRTRRTFQPTISDDGPPRPIHVIQDGEKMARITFEPYRANVVCLVPGCGFEVAVREAGRMVMQRELHMFYRDHRDIAHREYRGSTLFDYVLGEGWVQSADRTEESSSTAEGKINPD